MLRYVAALLLIQWKILGTIPVADGFSTGAPLSVCRSLLPWHGTPPQSRPNPYRISAHLWPDSSGRVNVTISSPTGVTFAGFMVQAQNHGGDGNPVGSFIVDSKTTKTQNCGSGNRNTATHLNKMEKSRVEMIWLPPKYFKGNIIFKSTVVLNYWNFWTDLKSSPLSIEQGPVVLPILPTPPPILAPVSPLDSQSAIQFPTFRPSTTISENFFNNATVVGNRINVASVWSLEESVISPYYGCNYYKGCFGFPYNCVVKQSCIGLFTYREDDGRLKFELFGRNRIWVAAAFSKDPIMGQDSVMDCVFENGEVRLYSSYNEPADNHRVPDVGLELLTSSYENDNLYCEFVRERFSVVEGIQFDLHEPHYLLVASGMDLEPDRVGYHGDESVASARLVNLAEVFLVEEVPTALVKVHGSLMVIAWILAASTGILLARFYKYTWIDHQRVHVWFIWHRILMLITWALTIVAFVIIFFEIQEWSRSLNPHGMFGLVTTVLTLVQPFAAFCRPTLEMPNRPLFNYSHNLIGSMAHLAAIISIGTAVYLVRALLPWWTIWIIIYFVGFYALVHFILFAAVQNYKHEDSKSSDSMTESTVSSRKSSKISTRKSSRKESTKSQLEHEEKTHSSVSQAEKTHSSESQASERKSVGDIEEAKSVEGDESLEESDKEVESKHESVKYANLQKIVLVMHVVTALAITIALVVIIIVTPK